MPLICLLWSANPILDKPINLNPLNHTLFAVFRFVVNLVIIAVIFLVFIVVFILVFFVVLRFVFFVVFNFMFVDVLVLRSVFVLSFVKLDKPEHIHPVLPE